MDTMQRLLEQTVDQDQAPEGIQDEMSVAQNLMARDVADNEPLRPVHARPNTMMTKAQLLRQKAMEAAEQGQALPTGPSRMDALEAQMNTLATAMTNLVQTLSPKGPPTQGPPDSTSSTSGSAPRGQIVAPQTEYVAPQATSLPGPLSASSTAPRPAVISTPPAAIDAENGDIDDDAIEADPSTLDSWEPVQTPSMKTGSQSDRSGSGDVVDLARRVREVFASKDLMPVWRRTLTSVGAQFKISRWPEPLRREWYTNLQELVRDQRTIEKACGHLLSFEHGNVVGPESAAVFVLACAGFTALLITDPVAQRGI